MNRFPRPFRPISQLLVLALFTLAALPLAAGAAEAPAAAAPAASPATSKAVVNINTAETAQLMLLPRIGPAVAARILEHRKANGPFKSAEELMLVKGIGEKTFALLKPYVAVSGQTTLAEKVRSPRPQPTGDGR